MRLERVVQWAEEGLLLLRRRVAPAARAVRPTLALLAVLGFAWRFLIGVGPAGLDVLRVVGDLLLAGYALEVFFAVVVLDPDPLHAVRARPHRAALALLAAAYLALTWFGIAPGWVEAQPARWVVLGLVVGSLVGEEAYRVTVRGISALHLSPPAVVVLSFLLLISVGTGLLLSPRAAVQVAPGAVDHHLTLMQALFTATSASCITGLVVIDTGTELTRYGQSVVLALMQIGGLGMMTLFAFFAAAVGRGMRVKDQVLVRDMLQADAVGMRLGRLLVMIVGFTLLAEAIGAACLYGALGSADGAPPLPSRERLFYAVFHSVSAFCNAGFALHADSLARYRGDMTILFVLASLFVVGGLGFPVVYDVLRWLGAAMPRRRGARRGRPRRLTIQSRLVLGTSLVLGVGGALLIAVYEQGGEAFDGYSGLERAAAAVFTSLTCRTAGFNVPDTGALATGSIITMLALMFIGGSPGSTAGGVKTTTVALIGARVIGLLRRREEIEIGDRMLPRRAIALANGVVTLAICGIVGFCLLLSGTDPELALRDMVFEVVSALGTVGLSTGVTSALSEGGQLVIVLAMFMGRIGPLTLMLAIASGRRAPTHYAYPTARVMIG